MRYIALRKITLKVTIALPKLGGTSAAITLAADLFSRGVCADMPLLERSVGATL